MKFKKLAKCSLATALILGGVGAISGCNKEETMEKQQEATYSLYVQYMNSKGEEPATYEEWLKSIKGEKGDKGDPGKTPVITIGENGNWFVDNVDTNVKAQGSYKIDKEEAAALLLESKYNLLLNKNDLWSNMKITMTQKNNNLSIAQTLEIFKTQDGTYVALIEDEESFRVIYTQEDGTVKHYLKQISSGNEFADDESLFNDVFVEYGPFSEGMFNEKNVTNAKIIEKSKTNISSISSIIVEEGSTAKFTTLENIVLSQDGLFESAEIIMGITDSYSTDDPVEYGNLPMKIEIKFEYDVVVEDEIEEKLSQAKAYVGNQQ